MWEKKTSEDAGFHVYAFNRFIALQAVSHSGPSSTDMSLCYANRSAALFHLGQYEVSIRMPAVVGEDCRGFPGELDLPPCFYLRTLKLGPVQLVESEAH